MALLAVAASLAAPEMASFFRGRALELEARRMLTLTHYGQSRAVSEGVPVLLWINTRNSTYGLSIQSGFTTGDTRAVSYTADSCLTIETPVMQSPPVSEQQDERFGLPDDLAVIRFNPDGYFDEISQPRIVLREGTAGALELVQMANRLGYEIRTPSIH